MVRFDIQADKTALLIIDMENAFLKPGGPHEVSKGRDLVPRLNKLIHACREAGIWTIFIRNAFRADGRDLGLFTEFIPAHAGKSTLIEGTPDADLYSEIDRRKGDTIVTKQIYSAFIGTELDLLLRINGIDTLIIGGVQTQLCCEATVRDARHRNYKVIFLSNGTATSDQPDIGWGALSADEIQKYVLNIMAFRYAEVLSVEEVLERLQGS